MAAPEHPGEQAHPQPIRLLAIRRTPLCPDEVFQAVGDAAAGGMALFVGTVRNHDADVDGLGHACHPLRSPAVGDTAVAVAVACPHRGDAFEACGELIDGLKHEVPIWRHQKFSDGTDEWVGA
ncbi:molybdopterin biosynthesis protein MoeE [Streptomyces qaidamensis]|uniref:Molybdopterin biosynthesis protein MoeE n=1 Tax=Streptomyces qaidamensis TaxID=1783515 RepID=A0A143BV17_9ACTN|nr:molybdenum cofactor biosynthesis protein MoaE [Streptomyces qaidamensis]AMW08984.1 molybdopterin biosynthesis protein MoeE [Streptomyces qaidamensis]